MSHETLIYGTMFWNPAGSACISGSRSCLVAASDV